MKEQVVAKDDDKLRTQIRRNVSALHIFQETHNVHVANETARLLDNSWIEKVPPIVPHADVSPLSLLPRALSPSIIIIHVTCRTI